MGAWRFAKGLHDFGNGCFAWLTPDGSWGYSNAGLIVDGDQSLLVDTLFDLKLTREMLDEMHRRVPTSRKIDTLVNTHANGDHTFGNQLVQGARIVATTKCRDEMLEKPPEFFRNLFANWKNMGDAGAFMHEVMGSRFDFSDVIATPPTSPFDGALSLNVGRKTVELLEVGPAHTPGDLLVYVPQDKTVFTGDIMFVKGHPIIWAGPISNWIAACDKILSWEVETIVPGHGTITDKNGVRELKRYLEYILVESRKRYDAGMKDEEAANDIGMDSFADWGESERLVVNVNAAYREFDGRGEEANPMRLFGLMAKSYFRRKGCPACKGANGIHAH